MQENPVNRWCCPIKTKFVLIFFIVMLGITVFPETSASQECIHSKFQFDIKPGADQPSDISIAPTEDIYLVDGVNNRVVVVDGKGQFKFTFGKQGRGKGEFNYPLGIDISDDGQVFIADSGNHRIQVFNLNGGFKYMFAVKAGAGEKPSDPVDVLVSRLNKYVYISDNDNHKIKVYRQNGIFEFEWGKMGEGQGEFRYPGMLAANKYNEIFVVDVLNTRIQKFDPFGNFIAEIGSWGVLPGKLFRPKGVAVDSMNRVFITDSYLGFIQVFSDLGQFLGLVCENADKRRFVTPVGLAVNNRRQTLLVVEMQANKISVLKLLR